MGDITRTKADVRPLAGAIIRRGEAGGTIEAGEAVYLDGTNGWKICDDDAGSGADHCRGVMVAPQDAADGDIIDICMFGPVTGYSGMTPDGLAYVSDDGELGTTAGSNSKIVGWAESAVVLIVNCSPDGDA